MRNVTELQNRLIELGYLAAGEADGRFGEKSLAAFNHYRASKGMAPVGHTSLTELNAVIFTDDPKPQRQRSPVMGNLLGSVFDGLLGNLLRSEAIKSWMRNALVGLGASFVTNGLITSADLNTVVGAIMVVVSLLLSTLSANTKQKAMDVVKAVDAAPDVVMVPASDTGTGKPLVIAK